MAGLRYYVLDEGGQWTVRFKGADFPYPSRDAAIAAAVETAQKISLVEENVQILQQSPTGEWQIIWTSRPVLGAASPLAPIGP